MIMFFRSKQNVSNPVPFVCHWLTNVYDVHIVYSLKLWLKLGSFPATSIWNSNNRQPILTVLLIRSILIIIKTIGLCIILYTSDCEYIVHYLIIDLFVILFIIISQYFALFKKILFTFNFYLSFIHIKILISRLTWPCISPGMLRVLCTKCLAIKR